MSCRPLVVVFALAVGVCPCAYGQEVDTLAPLLARIEQVAKSGDTAAYLALLTSAANRERATDFCSSELLPGATRTVVKERDREPLRGTLPGNGYRLMVDVLTEFGPRARAATWRLDVKRVGDRGSAQEWAIDDEERLSSVENLYRLALNPAKVFAARDLRVAAEDLDLTLTEGSVYIADIDQGATAAVLVGRGTMSFHPTPETERGQVKIFAGSETLETRFDVAFIRLNPYDFESALASTQLKPKLADPKEFRRAEEVFREDSQKSFLIDLGDLSRDPWSLLPGSGDFLAEVHTRRFDTLTYAKSSSEAEDITVFDRKRHHNISIYPSKRKIANRGRFYNEDELVDYDVLDYDIDVAITPERQWLDGRVRLRLKVRALAIGSLTMRLAESLVVQSIVSYEHGRLFGVRVKNQNTIVVNLPTTLQRDAELTLTVTYAGRLEPQTPDRETLALTQGRGQEEMSIAAEPSFLYSNRSYWYPQAPVSDYATAIIRISVPTTLDCVASGELEPGFPTIVANTARGTPRIESAPSATSRKLYVFRASQPLRYLAFVVSRFARAETATLAFPPRQDHGPASVPLVGPSYSSLNLSVEANPRQVQRGRELGDRAADIALFYHSLIGDVPYSAFTIALVESDLPGGHSPGYFAALNQPLPTSPLVWRNDPAAFSSFPDFFLAHELAHQWWGQAIGWRNYHEQWLSEGFAQYFAALYAQKQKGDDVFASVLRQLRKWGMDNSDQGPVYLGYRLGHVRDQSRIFRALVYNKGAAVLHMLRRLVGDDAFFSGVRRFYRTMRFKKAGTEDFRAAMEAASGRSLERFFERWIYNSSLPRLTFNHRVEGSELVLHFEQTGEVFDVPVTVVLNYGDRKSTVVVPITERVVDKRVPLEGTLRGVEINKDDGTLAEINKTS
jgi:Peptidase family M1 domain